MASTPNIMPGNTGVQRAVVTTNATGLATWTFPMEFPSPPTVQVTIAVGSGQPYIPLITALSATAITVKVLRARALPAAFASLFDVFGGAVGAGVPVHIWAVRQPTTA